VTMNGRCDVVKLTIDPKAIDPADPSLLEDLLTAALNATAEKARAAADEHLGKATGGVKIPGIMG
jgi:DNA-binding protein YbaB